MLLTRFMNYINGKTELDLFKIKESDEVKSSKNGFIETISHEMGV